MRISPLPSSISTSAWTFGPYFFARAAMIPSCSNPYSSARSSCFTFDNSRNAARISAEPIIRHPMRKAPKRLPTRSIKGERKAELPLRLLTGCGVPPHGRPRARRLQRLRPLLSLQFFLRSAPPVQDSEHSPTPRESGANRPTTATDDRPETRLEERSFRTRARPHRADLREL